MAKKQGNAKAASNPPHPFVGLPHAGFFRRMGALVYDSLVVVAILMAAAGSGFLVAYGLLAMGVISLEGYPDLGGYLGEQLLFQLYIWSCALGFYVWFWCHGGQTLGMRAWRLRVQNADGSNISYTQALIRLATATLGLGNLMALFDRKHNAFQDLWAKCEVVVLTPEQNQHRNWDTL